MPIIHVNSNTIRSNKKYGNSVPPLSVRKTRSAKAVPANRINIHDAAGALVAKVVYMPDSPLSCGAQVWIETEHEVTIEEDNNES